MRSVQVAWTKPKAYSSRGKAGFDRLQYGVFLRLALGYHQLRTLRLAVVHPNSGKDDRKKSTAFGFAGLQR
jgi:hypothetical protein